MKRPLLTPSDCCQLWKSFWLHDESEVSELSPRVHCWWGGQLRAPQTIMAEVRERVAVTAAIFLHLYDRWRKILSSIKKYDAGHNENYGNELITPANSLRGERK